MSHSTAICGVCDVRKLSKPSTFCCIDCDEGLCFDCKKQHNLPKATINHNIIPLNEFHNLQRNLLNIPQYCTKHKEIFQTFCKKHDCPCCRKCIIETHNDCKDLNDIDEYIKDFKSSASFFELEGILNETAANIKKLRTNRQENLSSLQTERKRIKQEIDQTRFKINKHLDKIQDDLIQDLVYKEENESRKIQQVLKSLNEKEEQLKQCHIDLIIMKKYASDVQLFLSVKQIENDMVKNETFVQSMIASEGLCQAVLALKDPIDIEQITTGMPYIGNVGVDYSPSLVVITNKKEKQAQMMATKATVKSINNIALEFQKKITACGDGVTGCTLLPHGKIAFANEKEMSIRVVKPDGLLDFKIKLKPFIPFDIAYYSDTIVVTTARSNLIKTVDINTKHELKSFLLDVHCTGIMYTDNKLVSCTTKKGIIEFNQQNGAVKTIIKGVMYDYAHITQSQDKIYCTNTYNKSVMCYDQFGKIQWTFLNRRLIKPLGVTVDTNGNVFVACNYSSKVFVISPDGQQYKQLLSSKDGVKLPNGLIYIRQNNQLLVTNYDKGALLYDVV